ncbi:solute carrier family 15 member 2-like isoform X2 [Macrotis lagotis]|uniref:solute carrier family 15 member 2-like isoform X2 n=1 Tax=Macrotis lagotis TaxID=92651 RepID=UPI003D69961C
MEISCDEKCKDDDLLKLKKTRNKYPVSVVIMLILKWIEGVSFSGIHGFLIFYFISSFSLFNHESVGYQIFKTFTIILAFISATITDSWLGKFNTFIGSTVLLLVGHIIVIIKETITEDLILSRFLVILGIVVVTVASSIDIPCMLCLVADQFPEHQVKERRKIFSFLYLSISFGIFFTNISIPSILDKKCSYRDCYMMYFGIPAGIVTFNLVTLIFSKKFFFIETPEGSSLLKILKCIQFAIKNHLRYCSWKIPRRDHWLDWASEKFSSHIHEVKLFFRMLIFISPFPIFWALVEKQEMFWNLQAKKMNLTVAGKSWEIRDLQIIFSAVLIIIFILMELFFIPFLQRPGLNFSLIKKILLGMVLIYLSSLISFFLELQIENAPNFRAGSKESLLRIINVADSSFNVTFYQNKSHNAYSTMASSFEITDYMKISLDSDHQYFQIILFSPKMVKEETILLEQEKTYAMILTGTTKFYSVLLFQDRTDKSRNAYAFVRIINTLKRDVFIILSLKALDLEKFNGTSPELRVKIKKNINLLCKVENKNHLINLGPLSVGASYLIFIIQDIPELEIWKIQLLEMKNISIGWQFVQFFIMGLGKYLLIVSCSEYFYYKAPRGMKVTMQALWLSTLFSSSLILSFVTYISLLPEWTEYFLLSNLLLLVIICFLIISYYYQETL